MGVALGNAINPETGVLNAAVDVAIPTDETWFCGKIYHTTAASAVAAPATQLGSGYDLRNDATLGWCVAIDSTSNKRARIVDYSQDRDTGLPTWPNATTAGTNLNPVVWYTLAAANQVLNGVRTL